MIKGETSGHLERVLVALCQSKADFLATEINCALKALKTDEATVAEIICSQTCQDIAAIRTSYQQRNSFNFGPINFQMTFLKIKFMDVRWKLMSRNRCLAILKRSSFP